MNESELVGGAGHFRRIETDDHIFLKMDDGSIVREKRRWRNLIALLFFGAVLGGLVVLLALRVGGFFAHGGRDLLGLTVLVALIAIIGFIFVYTVRLTRQPPLRLDASARVLRVGEEAIPFARVSRISAPYRRLRSSRFQREGRSIILVEFHDRESIVLASVTGAEPSVEWRVRAVLEMVSALLGVPSEFEGIAK